MTCCNGQLLAFLVIAQLIPWVSSSCAMLNDCNGHGYCNYATITCECFEGWGAATDITTIRAPDCSLRTCPSGRSWADVPINTRTAHAIAECSDRGRCNRVTGKCECYNGFLGDACQRMGCPNDCSGHGRCYSMEQLAYQPDALPLSPTTVYDNEEDTVTWDAHKLYGCICDSSWPVGLGPGQRQEPEWFGPDCSFRHCPSGDDPNTEKDETDCTNKTAAGGFGVGESGNICQVDCANRGICNYRTGICSCFDGYYSENCALTSVLAHN